MNFIEHVFKERYGLAVAIRTHYSHDEDLRSNPIHCIVTYDIWNYKDDFSKAVNPDMNKHRIKNLVNKDKNKNPKPSTLHKHIKNVEHIK